MPTRITIHKIVLTLRNGYRDNLKDNMIKTAKNWMTVTRQTLKNFGKEHGNVIGSPIIDLPDPLENAPPGMHTMMGLLNDTLDEEFIDIAALDEKHNNYESKDDNKVKMMEKLEERREELEKELDEIALASGVHSSERDLICLKKVLMMLRKKQTSVGL